MDSERLLQLLKPVRLRLLWIRAAEVTPLGLTAGLAAGILLALLARIIPLANYRMAALGLILLGGAAGVLYVLLRRVSPLMTARVMDRGTAEDTVTTALSFLQQDSPIARLQREDAIRYAQSYRLPGVAVTPRFRRRLWVLGVNALLLLVLLVFPNPMDEIARKQQAEAAWIDEQEQQVEALHEQLKAEKLPEPGKQTLEQTLQKLEQGLEKSPDTLKALDEMEKSMQELKSQAETWEKLQAKADAWGEQLRRQPMLQELGEKLRQRDAEGMAEAMGKLHSEMLKLTPEQKEQLAKELEKLAAAAVGPDAETEKKLRETMEALAKPLKEQAASAAQGVAGQDAKQLEEALKQLQEQMAKALEQLQLNEAQMAAALAQAAAIAQMGLPMATQMAAQGIAIPAAWSANGLAGALAAGTPSGSGSPGSLPAAGASSPPGTQPGTGTGSGSGSGTGTGTGSGTGSGSGSSIGSGNGAGTGSGTGGAGSGAAAGTGAGTGSGHRNLVTTPRSMSGSGNVQSDRGPVTGGNGEVQKGGPSPMLDGVSRPYEEVYSEYEAQAKQALDRQPLPQNMQHLVRDYFTEIQPNP